MPFSFLQYLNIYHHVITSSKVSVQLYSSQEMENVLFKKLSQFRKSGEVQKKGKRCLEINRFLRGTAEDYFSL